MLNTNYMACWLICYKTSRLYLCLVLILYFQQVTMKLDVLCLVKLFSCQIYWIVKIEESNFENFFYTTNILANFWWCWILQNIYNIHINCNYKEQCSLHSMLKLEPSCFEWNFWFTWKLSVALNAQSNLNNLCFSLLFSQFPCCGTHCVIWSEYVI